MDANRAARVRIPPVWQQPHSRAFACIRVHSRWNSHQPDTLRHGKMRASAAAGAGYTNWNPLASMTILKNTRAFRLSVHRTTPLLVAAFIAFAGLHVSEAQDSTGSSLASDVAALRSEIAKLQQEVETLRAENAALQRENESLRRMLSTRNADQPASASRTNSVRQPASPRPLAHEFPAGVVRGVGEGRRG